MQLLITNNRGKVENRVCHFKANTNEKSFWGSICFRELSTAGRNNRLYLLFTTLVIMLTLVSVTINAQNIILINNVHGITNDTIVLPISINNSDEFISFQCDIVLPVGFEYIPGSIALTQRSNDHVITASKIENTIFRILSYSLNNSSFLSDSGVVAFLSVITPSIEGNYVVTIENGIIGNHESENILDSLVPGEINLTPAGVLEYGSFQNIITCYPNPFHKILNLRFNTNSQSPVIVKVVDLNETLLSSNNISTNGKNNFVFDEQSLLGNNLITGCYFISFDFHIENRNYHVIKKIWHIE